jgi:L-ribulose-5-phosphate 4-epimerase
MTGRALREAAYEANVAIQERGLVLLTWGNASVCDRARGLLAIKPSGVAYRQLAPANMVLVELESGRVVDSGKWRPSSDTPTHRALYLAFDGVGAIVHTHSRHATAWAQAGRDLPCFGTTHADYFHGAVPCTGQMTTAEILEAEGYEYNTGLVITREFKARRLDPLHVPGVLVRGHAPFAWGKDATAAVETAVVLEAVAEMALETLAVNPSAQPISAPLLDKHFLRKHGAHAYYGQPSPAPTAKEKRRA